MKPKAAKHPVVIYAFHCTEGSRGVYVGKHEVRKGDPRQWPSLGVGKLPSGYGGSGHWIRAARAKYGHDAFRWFVLGVVEPGQDYANAEARAVAAAREEFGERCKNIQNGGDGFDSEAGRRQNLERWKCPEYRQRKSESARGQWQDPKYRQRISESAREQLRGQWQDPEYRQRISEAARGQWRNPEFRQRVSEAWADPAIRAAMHRTTLQKRLAAAVKRRNLGEPPLPLDNPCLEAFDELRNPLPCVLPREPRSEALLSVLEALRQHSEGLTAPELCELLGRPEYGPGGVRNALDNLRQKCFQPILNDGGIFVLLAEGEY